MDIKENERDAILQRAQKDCKLFDFYYFIQLPTFLQYSLFWFGNRFVNFIFSVQDNPNPDWPSVKMSSKKLCNGDYDRPLKIQVFDFDNDGKHDFIGEFYTTVNEVHLHILIITPL